jgi:hypothetical protein
VRGREGGGGGGGGSLRNEAEAAHVGALLRALLSHAPEFFRTQTQTQPHPQQQAPPQRKGAGPTAAGAAAAAGANPAAASAEGARVVVLAPYQEQLRCLRAALHAALGASAAAAVELATVDGFQGREAEVVLYSATRASAGSRGIGFVADVRRLNVALTRGRRSLVVVGCARTLTAANATWRALAAHAQERGCLLSAEEALARCAAPAAAPPPPSGAAGGGGGQKRRAPDAAADAADEPVALRRPSTAASKAERPPAKRGPAVGAVLDLT